MNKIAIITGGSKGIGEALVNVYGKNGYKVYSLSRTLDRGNAETNIYEVRVDLNDANATSGTLDFIFKDIGDIDIGKIVLINNAGTLGNIGPLEKSNLSQIQSVINVNFTAAAILCAKFIEKAQKLNAEKSIVNISSGAATRAYFGWSLYCSTKAAIEMLTQCIAKEQNEKTNGVKCIAIIPGVVDTAMQTEVRQSSPEDFTSHQRFMDLKENNLLSDPATVAVKIFAADQDQTIHSGEIVSVREN